MDVLLTLLLLAGLGWWVAASRRSRRGKSSGRSADDTQRGESAIAEVYPPGESGSVRRSRGAKQLRILYEDADGTHTERVVRVLDARLVDDDVMFDAWCSLRGDERTFRASRVSYAESASDGEPINDLEQHLCELFRVNGSKAALRTHPEWWSPEMSAASLLVWLAAADGRIDRSQRQVVIDFARGVDARFSESHWETLNYRGRRLGAEERSEVAGKVKLGGPRLASRTLQAALKVHGARKLGSAKSELDALGELRRLLS